MKNRKKTTVYNIVFAVICTALFYLLPYIGLLTMPGDKTDILMGMMFVYVPFGLMMLSLLYGLFTERLFASICIAPTISIPYLFIPVVSGHSITEKIAAAGLVIPSIVLVGLLGASIGILLRKLISAIRCKLRTK